MSTPNTTVKTDSPSSTATSYQVAGEWEEVEASTIIEPGELEKSTTSNKQTKTQEKRSSATRDKQMGDEISLTELMFLVSETLASFSEIQSNLAKATDGIAETQNKALIKAAQKILQDAIDAMAAQKAAARKAGIFKNIAMAFTIAVSVLVVVGSAGTLSATLLPLAMTLLTTVKTTDGKGVFNYAVEGIVNALPDGNYNKQLIAALIVTAAATLLGGAGASAVSSPAVTAMTVEISAQVALDAGLPQALGDATGKEWVMWLTTSLLMVTMVGSGLKGAKQTYDATLAAGQQPLIAQIAVKLSKFTGNAVGETQVMVQQLTRALQGISQLIAASFQIATGAKTMDAAQEGYKAEINVADLLKNHSTRSLTDKSTSDLQETLMELISEIYDAMTSLTAKSGQDLETLARVTI